ncbi:META domain-containing protein [Defluviimonas sp. WL0050]|nr:META domain-containing protein [Defluviimonas sp. WL0050]
MPRLDILRRRPVGLGPFQYGLAVESGIVPDGTMRLIFILPLLLATACQGNETVAAYGAGNGSWQLTEIDGVPFPARATLSFPEPGRIAGEAPCNIYSGRMDAPYPWFEAKDLAVTRRACPDLAEETTFFEGLSAMTLSEISGDTLILSTPDGREMVFTKDQP